MKSKILLTAFSVACFCIIPRCIGAELSEREKTLLVNPLPSDLKERQTHWQRFRGPLLKLANNNDAEKRFHAVTHIGKYNLPEATQTLISLLQQEIGRLQKAAKFKIMHQEYRPNEVIQAAQYGLSIQNHPQTVALLENCYRQIRSPMGRRVITKVYLQSKSQFSEQTILRLLKRETDLFARVGLIRTLGKLKSTAAVSDLLSFLQERQPFCIRLATIRALAKIPSTESLGKLIDALPKAKGRIRNELLYAVACIANQPIEQNADAWKTWWAKEKANYKIDAEKQEQMSSKLLNWDLGEKTEIEYYDIPLHGNRVLFVIDRSGSMQVGESPSRIEGVRNKLCELIQKLGPETSFNIISYSSNVTTWQRKQLPSATPQAKAVADKHVKGLRPAGATQTVNAMEEGLEKLTVQFGVETIFLLTDGAPFVQNAYIPLKNAGADILNMNEFLGVRIHTLGIYSGHDTTKAQFTDRFGRMEPPPHELGGFLKRIADNSGGIYKEIN